MWKARLPLYIVVKKKSRRGTLVCKKGSRWRFRPDGWKKTVPVCPFRDRWHYDFHTTIDQWPRKLAVILRKDNLKPLRYEQERYGAWRGVRTCRTISKKMTVWQVRGTNKLYVGHIGVWYLVNSTLEPMNRVPDERGFFIGRGKLSPKTFKCLKICAREQPRRVKLQTLKPFFPVPVI